MKFNYIEKVEYVFTLSAFEAAVLERVLGKVDRNAITHQDGPAGTFLESLFYDLPDGGLTFDVSLRD